MPAVLMHTAPLAAVMERVTASHNRAAVALICKMCCCTPAATPVVWVQAATARLVLFIAGLMSDVFMLTQPVALEGVTSQHHSQGAAQAQQKVLCCRSGA